MLMEIGDVAEMRWSCCRTRSESISSVAGLGPIDNILVASSHDTRQVSCMVDTGNARGSCPKTIRNTLALL